MKPSFKLLFRWTLLVFVVVITTAGCLRLGNRPKVPPVAGVFTTQTRGESWEPRHRLVTASGVGSLGGISVRAVYHDPQDANATYLSVAGAGLIYTYEGGRTWQQSPVVAAGTVNAVAVDPRAACTMYVAHDNRLIKSSDCTRSFQEKYVDPRPNAVTSVVVDGEDSNVVLLGTSAGELLRSTTAGTSWSRIYQFPSGLSWMVVDPTQPKRLFLLTARNGLYRSQDRGLQWESLAASLQPFSGGQEITSLQFTKDKSNSLFLLNRYGLLRSLDGGTSWVPLQLITPPLSTKIYAFAVNPLNSREIYYATASTFYLSTDGGINWVTRRLPGRQAVPRAMYIHASDPRTLNLAFEIIPSR